MKKIEKLRSILNSTLVICPSITLVILLNEFIGSDFLTGLTVGLLFVINCVVIEGFFNKD